ncbi:DUF4064 domain-containing protein [Niallia sp. 01092]|uniref:DUF4064 domain-containing protein n=1 Tax=unclassified Niallia TaxID=2837522 RepID=UPI003FD3030E
MKRTGEIVLGVIGVILSAFFVILGVFKLILQYNESTQSKIRSSLQDSGISGADLNSFMHSMTSGGWLISIAALLVFILGIVAIASVKKNKNPKKAGILFILSALIIGISTLGGGFLPAILYLIAGIMSLVRKPKESFNANSSF